MTWKSVVLSASVASALALLGSSGQAQGQGNAPEFVPNELLVQFRSDVGPGEQARARGLVNGARAELIVRGDRDLGRGELELMRIPPGLGVAAAMRELANDAAVEFSEPNWIHQHFATSNDPYYTNGSLWGMYGDATSPANQYGSQAGEAWATGNTGSSSVYVGIIDEGVMFSHSDLGANMWVNPFDPVDGVDNNGNGYIDDVRGWDFDGNNNSTYDGTQDDHGTHVAGTIGARGGNGIGVAGVTWNVTMITAKFLGRRGGTTANAIKAVNYMTDLKQRHGLNLVATNNSWGGGGFSQSLKNAIDAGCNANILFVAAAGNGGLDGVGDNNDVSPSYPASYTSDCIIAVAAITSSGAKSSFSNYGATSVDIGAPGSGIVSTLPAKSGSTYGSYSGTSMATPHVTGAAALYAATHSESASQIKSAILSSAVPTPSLAGKVVSGGRLNVSGF